MIKPELILLIRLLVLVFMSILFVQSAMDKMLNYKDNQQWIDGYFAKSFVKGQSKILLLLLTLLECSAGVLCLMGIFFSEKIVNPVGFYGLFLCSISFLSLFLGQRIAKDYAGAANIPGYFVVCLIGLMTYLV
jgi:nitric oxide reductase large subunit